MSNLGCKRDRFDARDYLMRAYLPAKKLPKKADWTAKMTPVRDQGDEGTCVGFAVACGMKEYQERQDYDKVVLLSPRYIYQEAKKLDGMPQEEGTEIRVAMKALKTKGVCRERFWPYQPHQRDKAKKGAVADARRFRVITYARILNLAELRHSLAFKGPCIMGVLVFKGMMASQTGVVPMPERFDRIVGGHAICPVGYDDKKKLIKFKNSWSAKWGAKGYGWLPYEYIEQYMMDAWSSVDFDDPNPLTLASVLRYANRKV